MKLIRCVVHPSQLNEIFDMLQEFDISSLTVTAGRERCREQHQRLYYRGCKYKLRFMPVSVIEVTAPNHEVDDIVRAVTAKGNIGQKSDDSRILVMNVDEASAVYARPLRIA